MPRAKIHSVSWKAYFPSCYLKKLLLFLCTSKMISRAWGNTPKTFWNHSKWSTYDEDINKCSVVGRRSVMSQSTLLSNLEEYFVCWWCADMMLVMMLVMMMMISSSSKVSKFVREISLGREWCRRGQPWSCNGQAGKEERGGGGGGEGRDFRKGQ